MVGFTLWNFKMSQHGVRSWAMAGFQFRTWGVTGAPGWFTNSGEFAIEMCIFFPLAGYLAYGLWPQLARNARIAMGAIAFSALVSIIASSSRGGLIGAGAVGIWMILRSPQKLKTLALVASLSWVTWTLLPEGSKARFESIGTDDTSQHRLDYWRDGLAIAAQHPLLGIGYDNWIPYYQKFYNETGELPHNFFIECIAELGYSGGAALILVFGAYFLQNAKVRRITAPTGRRPDRFLWAASYGLDGAMVGFIASGSFVTVLYYPFIWMNVAMSMALYGAVLREVRAATPIRNGPRRPA
jgi:O-antigen ligase